MSSWLAFGSGVGVGMSVGRGVGVSVAVGLGVMSRSAGAQAVRVSANNAATSKIFVEEKRRINESSYVRMYSVGAQHAAPLHNVILLRNNGRVFFDLQAQALGHFAR